MAIIQNGSPLFTGGAGSGPGNIQTFTLVNDWQDAIARLSTDMSINAGIPRPCKFGNWYGTIWMGKQIDPFWIESPRCASQSGRIERGHAADADPLGVADGSNCSFDSDRRDAGRVCLTDSRRSRANQQSLPPRQRLRSPPPLQRLRNPRPATSPKSAAAATPPKTASGNASETRHRGNASEARRPGNVSEARHRDNVSEARLPGNACEACRPGNALEARPRERMRIPPWRSVSYAPKRCRRSALMRSTSASSRAATTREGSGLHGGRVG